VRNAVRLPIDIDPSLTRRPPNHNTATLEEIEMPSPVGSVRAKIRLTESAVAVRLAFASAKKRLCLGLFADEARIHPHPGDLLTKDQELMRSIFTCMVRNFGTTRLRTMPMKAAITGTATLTAVRGRRPSRIATDDPADAHDRRYDHSS